MVCSEWDNSCLELAKTMERELIWKAREAHNDAIQWGVDVDSDGSSEDCWLGVSKDDERQKAWAASDSQVTTSCLPINHGWPSVSGEVEVKIEVVENVEEHSACRCL
jgi:hypothetical protein